MSAINGGLQAMASVDDKMLPGNAELASATNQCLVLLR